MATLSPQQGGSGKDGPIGQRGQASTALRARPVAVGRAVLDHGLILMAVLVPPLIAALAEGLWPLALALGLPALACGTAGIVARRYPPLRDLRRIEAVCTLALLFLIASVLPIPAFLVLGMGPLGAVFESVSGITSTGLSVAVDTMDWPLAAHVLRGWLQWAGGFAIAVAGLALILGPGPSALAMGAAGIDARNIMQSTRSQARGVLVAYALVTVVAVATLVPLLPTWWEGAVVALAAVSTGGFTPRADSLASYGPLAQGVTLFWCLATTMSLMFYVLIRRKGPGTAWRDTNAGVVLGAAAGGIAAVLMVELISGARDPGALARSAMNYLSGFTTAGFSVAPLGEAVPGTQAMILGAMLVGGGIGSTAGGVKIDRVMAVFGMVRLSIMRMRVPPTAVTRLKSGGEAVEADRIIAIAAVFCCYAVSAGVAWVIFLVSGQPALASLFDVVSALSTVGLSAGITGPDLAPHLKAVLIAAMLLGRLEFLALLACLSPVTWIQRS